MGVGMCWDRDGGRDVFGKEMGVGMCLEKRWG